MYSLKKGFIAALLAATTTATSAFASMNIGVVDGNGAELSELEPIAMPHREDLVRLLNKMADSEPTWTRLLKNVFDQDDLTIVKVKGPCFLADKPTTEIRAFYNSDIQMMGFCKAFDAQDDLRQKATVLHELTHHAFHQIGQNFKSGEEQATLLIESSYRKILAAQKFAEYKSGILELRELLDKYAPNLIGVAKSEEVVGRYKAVPLFRREIENGCISYPVPLASNQQQYIAAHFLEYFLNRLWSRGPEFQANQVLSTAKLSSIDDSYWRSYRALYFHTSYDFGKAKTTVLRENLTHPSERGSFSYVLWVTPYELSRSELSQELDEFLNKMGWTNIRTVGNYHEKYMTGASPDSVDYHDQVYFIR